MVDNNHRTIEPPNTLNFVVSLSDDLKRNISQKTQKVLLNILDAAVIDTDTAGPILTALVTTDAKAADNRYG